MTGFPEISIPSADVCLVLMPYAALERPSIALSILKATLAGTLEFAATVVYGNLLFADEIGAYTHDIVGKTQSHSASPASGLFPKPLSRISNRTTRTISRMCAWASKAFCRWSGPTAAVGSCPESSKTSGRAGGGFIDRLALQDTLASGPSIVGCSSTFQQHCASLALLRRIKELDPSVSHGHGRRELRIVHGACHAPGMQLGRLRGFRRSRGTFPDSVPPASGKSGQDTGTFDFHGAADFGQLA